MYKKIFLRVFFLLFFALLLSFFSSQVKIFQSVRHDLNLYLAGMTDDYYYELGSAVVFLKDSPGINYFLKDYAAALISQRLNASDFKAYYVMRKSFAILSSYDLADGMARDVDNATLEQTDPNLKEYFLINAENFMSAFFSVWSMVKFYSLALLGLSFFSVLFSGIFVALLMIVGTYSVFKLTLGAIILLIIFLQAKKVVAQPFKPLNVIKLNTQTGVGQNKFTLIFIHLRKSSGVLGVIPFARDGMQLGFGLNHWIKMKNFKGFIFNPLTLNTKSSDDGIRLKDFRLWNIASLKYHRFKFVSLSFWLKVLESGQNVFFSKNILTFKGIGFRFENTWGQKWVQQFGPVWEGRLHNKFSYHLFFNCLSPQLLKAEFSFVF